MTAPPRSCRPIMQGQHRKRGLVLVAALVCLLVVMAMLGQLLLALVHSGRQLHVERDRRQCELLLQAGLDRATRRLAADRDFTGETWEIDSGELLNRGAGQVTIERQADENQRAEHLLVTAEYPLGSERSIRRSYSISLESRTPGPVEE